VIFSRTLALLLLLAACAVVTPRANAEIILQYSFSGSAADVSGHGNGGVVTGPVTYVPGHDGQAIHFDNPAGGNSATQYVALPNLASLNSSTFSFAIEMRSTDTSQNNGRLFGNNFSSAGIVLDYNEGITAKSGMGVRDTNGFFPGVFGPTAGPEAIVTDGKWHWMVLVVDRAANQMRGYIDLNSEQVDITGLAATSFTGLLIGSGNDSGVTTYAARLTDVDEFRLYDHALTQAEVVALVAGPVAAPQPLSLSGGAALILLLLIRRGLNHWRRSPRGVLTGGTRG
jgi:hypothetical protein